MNIVIKKMESDDEIRGKAYVHWKSWQEAYSGIVDQRYLDSLTLEKCEETAYRWPDDMSKAKLIPASAQQPIKGGPSMPAHSPSSSWISTGSTPG